MKANLAHFVGDFAKALELPEWDLEPNADANGGRVLIVEGDLAGNTELYEQLRADAAGLGNYPVDLLACVPPSLVRHDGLEVYSVPGLAIREAGGKVWDTAAMDVR